MKKFALLLFCAFICTNTNTTSAAQKGKPQLVSVELSHTWTTGASRDIGIRCQDPIIEQDHVTTICQNLTNKKRELYFDNYWGASNQKNIIDNPKLHNEIGPINLKPNETKTITIKIPDIPGKIQLFSGIGAD